MSKTDAITSSQSISFGGLSTGTNLGIVLEELDSSTDTPFKKVVVYSRTPVEVSMTSGTFLKRGVHTGNKIELLVLNSSSSSISNPKAVNVQIQILGDMRNEFGKIKKVDIVYDQATNRIVTLDGKEIHGAIRVSYSYSGDIYECDISEAPLFLEEQKSLFSARTYSEDSVTGERSTHFADNILVYSPGGSSKEIIVEEVVDTLTAVDPPVVNTLKKVVVYCSKGDTVNRLTSGRIIATSDHAEKKVELIPFSGADATLKHPGIDGQVTLSKIGSFYDSDGVFVDPSLTYDSDTGKIKTSSTVKVYGGVKAEFSVKGKKYTCDISGSPLVSGKQHRSVFFAFSEGDVGSKELTYEVTEDSSKFSPFISQEKDANKNKDPGALSMKISEWDRFPPIVNSKDKEISVFFEIITVPSSLEMILEDIKDVRICTLQSSYDPNSPFKTKKNSEEELAFVSTTGGGSAGGSTTSTAVKNPEGLLIGEANDLSKIPYYAVPVRQYLNFMNSSTQSLNHLPHQIDLISRGAAWDFFGNPLEVSVKRPGEKVFAATWSYNLEKKEMVLEKVGEEIQVGPTEIAIVDSYDRLIPAIVQVHIEYKITKAFFLATMTQLTEAKGHDPKLWAPKDAYVFISGVYKLGLYEEDYVDKRRISGSWMCTSQRIKEQKVAKTNSVSK